MKGDAGGQTIHITRPLSPTRLLLVALAASTPVLAACGGDAEPDTEPAQVATRGCSTAGSGGVAADYRRHALLVGDVVLGGLRDVTERTPAPAVRGGRRGAIESVVVLPAGSEATITVSPDQRRHVGLIYDTGEFRDDGAYRIADLDSAFRFVACRDSSFNRGLSQFDGGYVVAGRRCVQIDVAVPDRPVRHVNFPAGAPCD